MRRPAPPGRHLHRSKARRGARLVACAGGALLLAVAWAVPRGAELVPSPEVLGERLYREGVACDGRPVEATVQGDVPLRARAAACAGCHRRSGLGSVEGSAVVPPVAGALLFAPAGDAPESGPDERPAYTPETLLRAVRDGVAPGGRTLSPVMPRYRLSDADGAALAAHLRSLGTGPDPGVTPEVVHLATIVTPGVEPERRKAVVDLLEAYVATRNAQSRHEVARRERAARLRMPEYAWFRSLALHVWELEGEPSSWRRQLDEKLRREPVFAVLGGIGGPWQEVHEFCEASRLPCLFPVTAEPGGGDGFYAVYLSGGVALEGETAAAFLATSTKTPGRTVQVYRDGAGARAASAFAAALGRDAGTRPGERRLEGPPTAGAWHRLLADDRPTTLVLWLPASDVAALAELGAELDGVARFVASATLLGDGAASLPEAIRRRLVVTYPWDLPEARARRFRRVAAWLAARSLPVVDDRLQADAFFAATLTVDALGALRGRFVRELLVEQLEHMTDSALPVSPYPRMSLGPGERTASKGCYVVAPGEPVKPLSDWIVP